MKSVIKLFSYATIKMFTISYIDFLHITLLMKDVQRESCLFMCKHK